MWQPATNIYLMYTIVLNSAYRLNAYGWDAKQIMVIVNCSSPSFIDNECEQWDGRHEIVKLGTIYIEATTGDVIMPALYKDYGIE